MHMGLWALVVIYAPGADTHNIQFVDKSSDQHVYALLETGHDYLFDHQDTET